MGEDKHKKRPRTVSTGKHEDKPAHKGGFKKRDQKQFQKGQRNDKKFQNKKQGSGLEIVKSDDGKKGKTYAKHAQPQYNRRQKQKVSDLVKKLRVSDRGMVDAYRTTTTS